MKYRIVFIILIILHIAIPSIAFNPFKTLDNYKFAKYNFKWITKDFYFYLDNKCRQYGIDPLFALSIAQRESNGKNIVSRKNRNGTRDWGYFQVNGTHLPKNKRHQLLNYKTNINKAMWYLNLCLKKSRGNKKLACIYYNAGLNCKVYKYKKSYPKDIVKMYNGLFAKI